MMKGKMEAAKAHYEALMAALAALGMDLMEFHEKMGSAEMPEMEESEEYAESGEEEGEEMADKKPIDKAKVAVIVARMKNKMKE